MRTAGGGRGIRACIVVTGITLFSIGPAAAIPIISLSGTASESYNDNVGLVSGAGQAAYWITALTPSITVNDQGRRVQFDLSYSPSELIFAGPTSFTALQQSLLSSGRVELLEDTFFIKEQASIMPEFLNGIGAVGPTTYTTNGNLQTIENYQLSSILRHHFGDITDTETNFDFGQVISSGNGLAPLQSEQLRQTFTSGTYFGRLGWTLIGYASRDRIGSVQDEITPSGVLKDDLARADFRYAVVPQLSITASGGYEQISFPTAPVSSLSVPTSLFFLQGVVSSLNSPTSPTSLSSLRGPTWNAGFAYTPNPTFSLRATYGSRYGAPDYELSASYNAPLTEATLVYTETIETTPMMLLSNVGALGFSSGLAIDTTTGLPFTGSGGYGNIPSLPLAPTNSAFLGKFLNASLQTTRDRNSFTAYASYGTEHIFSPPTTEAFYTGAVSWGRNLWPALTSNLSVAYTHGNFGLSGEYERTYSVLGSIAYTLSARSALTFRVAISREQTNVSSLAINDDIATVAYTRRF